MINNLNINTDSKFRQLTGTSGATWSLTADLHGNIYAAGNSGKIYRCLKGETTFQTIKTISCYLISSLIVDKLGNIYVLLFENAQSRTTVIYKYPANSTDFIEITGSTKMARHLAVDSNNVLYTFNDNGAIYRYRPNDLEFQQLTSINGLPQQLLVDKNNNIFILTLETSSDPTAQDFLSVIYRNQAGSSAFQQVGHINAGISNFTIDNNDNIYAGTSFFGQVYKWDKNHSEFSEIAKVDNTVSNYSKIVSDNLNNIYLTTDFYNAEAIAPIEDEQYLLYQSIDGTNQFQKLNWNEGHILDLITIDCQLYIATLENGIFLGENLI